MSKLISTFSAVILTTLNTFSPAHADEPIQVPASFNTASMDACLATLPTTKNHLTQGDINSSESDPPTSSSNNGPQPYKSASDSTIVYDYSQAKGVYCSNNRNTGTCLFRISDEEMKKYNIRYMSPQLIISEDGILIEYKDVNNESITVKATRAGDIKSIVAIGDIKKFYGPGVKLDDVFVASPTGREFMKSLIEYSRTNPCTPAVM